ncbi:conserved hypothetical protein [Trichophyton verrucosum HKI 0517]|uniref:Uncharacterized protein n=1 Tax=Trichophyton verrucosum (strain HKI 0517) TaxID=663202 RepID=D4DA04_TRIVH|nr:uncharacterized protein TRV_03948 [Trichophyton verrucosum HKI 0517]EFE41300.1 conserved hypothetical protein [Trichophyton verrucosum HKI 0517]
MSGLNPFRHKKTASTAAPGAVAAPDAASSSSPSSQTAASDSASLSTAQPGNRPRGQDRRQTGQDDAGRRPGPAEEWLAGLEVDVARQKKQAQTQQHHHGLSRPLFENSELPASRTVSNSKTVRIASPPAKQIPSPDNNDANDAEEGYFGSDVSGYTSAGSVGRQMSGHRPSTPGVQPAEDPFNAAIGSSGSSDEDDDDDDGEDDEIKRLNARGQDGLGLGLGPVADVPSLRRVSYQGDLRSKGQVQEHAGAGATKKRTTMDVDAFKRLLLTGDTAGDTKDSRDLSAAATAASTTQEMSAGDKKPQKPPPPKSRRGKAISSSSRSSESTEKSTEATAPVSPQATSHTKSPASSIHGAQPPSPPARRQAAQSEPVPPAHAQHKRPPTPPITRRHSQMKRSGTNTSRLALPPGSIKPLNRSASLNSATHPKTPPPPPSRRTGTGSTTDHGSIASSIHDTSSVVTPLQHQKAESETSPPHNPHLQAPSHTYTHTHTHTHPPTSTARPQPPPPRRTAGSTHSSHSTETNHPSSTSTSTRRPSSISAETEDHPIPPPPPPHRKTTRGSNPPEPDISPPSNANDILANLSQLQHDLDEFRGQYGDGDRDRSQKK